MHGAKNIKKGKSCHVCRGLQAFEAELNMLHKNVSEQIHVFYFSLPVKLLSNLPLDQLIGQC